MKYLKFSITFFILSYNLFSQELIFEDGIYIEKPNSIDTNRHKYSLDNISYKLNKIFIYDYYYIDTNEVKSKFIRDKSHWTKENPLNLIKYTNTDTNTIDKIKITVSDYLNDFSIVDSTYSQTVFTYDYLNILGQPSDTSCKILKKINPKYERPCGDETTGIIDNIKNLWMHPPRNYTFRILQLSPYPFYSLVDSIDKWSWNFEVGGFYLDNRWINHKKVIKVYSVYTRLPDEILETPFGKINCKVTIGENNSTYGRNTLHTSLKSYYNTNFGFVKLEYININKSKLVINLIETK
jgi:hypothetical protein